MNPFRKLLRAHLSPAQLTGFVLATLVGMVVVLGALQVYRDVRPLLGASDALLRGDYRVLSKRVSTLQTLGLGTTDFTAEELDDLRRQPFVRGVGAFTPADYRVTGSVEAGGMGFSTYLFFESVPDEFLDVATDRWHYEPGSREIPIVIPRNYLNLYNFGFARSQGLPQISEGVFRRVPLGIRIDGNGRSEGFRGRIVGLSDRLNTILVPESFIRWSNERFGSGEAGAPSRVIVETDREADEAVSEYLTRHGYEAEGEQSDDGRGVRLLRIAAVGVASVGLVFCLMSFFILMLSVFLLLQKNSREVETLLLLGYSPAQVAKPYLTFALALDFGVLVAALVVLRIVRAGYLPLLQSLHEAYRPAGMGTVGLCGFGLVLLFAFFTGWAIRRRVGRLLVRKG